MSCHLRVGRHHQRLVGCGAPNWSDISTHCSFAPHSGLRFARGAMCHYMWYLGHARHSGDACCTIAQHGIVFSQENLDAVPGMWFWKSSGQSGVVLGTLGPSGLADLPSAWASRKCDCRNGSGKRFRCSGAALLMIASILGSSASEHRCDVRNHCFRWLVAVIPSTASRRPWPMAWTYQGVCIPKPCPDPMGFYKKL